MARMYFLPVCIFLLISVGCNDHSVSVSVFGTLPSAFNLHSITFSSQGATFSWEESQGATSYKLCLKDVSKPDSCDEVTTSEENSCTVSHISTIKFLRSSFFIIASNEFGETSSNEKSSISEELTSLIQYIKSSNTEANDNVGESISFSADGYTLAVSAIGEDSDADMANGDQSDNSASDSGAVYIFRFNIISCLWEQIAYIKASNSGTNDVFGTSVSLSADGNTLAVGAPKEASNSQGINGSQLNNTAVDSGAVYVFRDVSGWNQQAYIKASNSEAGDLFGSSLSLSADGNTLVVGAPGEASNAQGVNGSQLDNSAGGSGAVYLFQYSSGWAQHSYIKASNTEAGDKFGLKVSLSSDGSILAVAAENEDSDSTGVNGIESNNSALDSGAVYLFRYGLAWAQQAYLKASNTDTGDTFGSSISLSADGTTLAVGAYREDSNSTGVNNEQSDNSARFCGAVYLFRYESAWIQQAYIKASNAEARDRFGYSTSLSFDGNTLAVGAVSEKSSVSGINGDEVTNGANQAGAAYLFRYDSEWTQEAYIKAPNTNALDMYGTSISISADGEKLAVGAKGEDSYDTGVNGDQSDNSAASSGAVYIY